MNDATGNTTRDTTDRATRHDGVTVTEAAVALGITPDSVRARLRRGSLGGEKIGPVWYVFLNQDLSRKDLHDSHQVPEPSATESDDDRATRHDTPRDAARQRDTTTRDTDHQPTIDLAPLVDHIATLEDQVQRLTEAAAIWQVRARQAEEKLLQLTAGNVAPDTELEPEPEPDTVDDEGPQLLQESDPAPTGVLAWWKRLWGS